MIHVIATITVKPGKRDAFLTEFFQLVPDVRGEVGCIEYGPAVDLDTGIGAQIPYRPDVVTVVEKWTDLEALKAHSVAPHMEKYRGRVKDLVVGTSLMILKNA